MKTKLIILSSLFLVACVSGPQPIKTETTVVEVPIPVPCKIKPVDKPTMPLDNARMGEDLNTLVSKALREIERRIGYEAELETAIKECNDG